jgi:lysozyme family protein
MIEEALQFILHWEGGFINDPKDPGGATQYGISFRFLERFDANFGGIDRERRH